MRTFHRLITLGASLWMQDQIMAFTPGSAAQIKINARQGLLHYSTVNLSNNNDFEDFPVDNGEGKDLAEQFYQQVKKREAASKLKEFQSDNLEQYDVKRTTQKKFTGRRGEVDSTGKPSAGLFSNGNGSVYAYPVEDQKRRDRSGYSSTDVLSQRDKMMRDEIKFMRVASSEGTIVAQGVLVLLLLGFTLYIGISGGITDGSERFGAFDGMINEFNGLGDSVDFSSLVNDDASAAINTDMVKEGSVWL